MNHDSNFQRELQEFLNALSTLKRDSNTWNQVFTALSVNKKQTALTFIQSFEDVIKNHSTWRNHSTSQLSAIAATLKLDIEFYIDQIIARMPLKNFEKLCETAKNRRGKTYRDIRKKCNGVDVELTKANIDALISDATNKDPMLGIKKKYCEDCVDDIIRQFRNRINALMERPGTSHGDEAADPKKKKLNPVTKLLSIFKKEPEPSTSKASSKESSPLSNDPVSALIAKIKTETEHKTQERNTSSTSGQPKKRRLSETEPSTSKASTKQPSSAFSDDPVVAALVSKITEETERKKEERGFKSIKAVLIPIKGTLSTEIIVTELHDLGERLKCKFCNAFYFPGAQNCCQKGKIFLPPMMKYLEPLHSLLYDVSNKKHRHFVDNSIPYNSMMSFASISYTHLPVGKYGVQVPKAQGPITHFPSAVLPRSDHLAFGNYYVYDWKEAAEHRKQGFLGKKLDKEIITDLSKMMESCNPVAKGYYNMGQVLNKMKKNSEPIDFMRLLIADKYAYEKSLQAHRNVYADPKEKIEVKKQGDFVSLMFSCTIDQQLLPKGLMVYPLTHPVLDPKPLHYYNRNIEPVAYALLFPRGEHGWEPEKYSFTNSMSTWEVRVRQFCREKGINIEDLDIEKLQENEESNQREDETDDDLNEESDSSDVEEDLEYDNELGETEHLEDTVEPPQKTVEFEVRKGDMIPLLKANPSKANIDNNEDKNIDYESDEEEVDDNESNEQLVGDTTEQFFDDMRDQIENREVDLAEPEEKRRGNVGPRKHVSFREFINYHYQPRKSARNRFTAFKKLGQLYLMDCATRLMQQRMEHIREHYVETRNTNKKKILMAFAKKAKKFNRDVGAIVSVPSKVPGSPRYMRKRFEECATMAKTMGHPDLFLTFTANGQWKEIKDNLEPGQCWADNPMLMAEVFQKKVKSLVEDIVGKKVQHKKSALYPKYSREYEGGIFGKVGWYCYTVEFQQRGAPHVHMLINLQKHVETTAEIDKICQATIPELPVESDPNYERIKNLRELVLKHQIHFPCDKDMDAYCNKGREDHWKQCRKHFPKEFNTETKWSQQNYPELRRPKTEERLTKYRNGAEVEIDNRWVVPYNSYLLSKYQCHLNMEVVSGLRVRKYLFKYIYKGFDRALVECFEKFGADANDSHGVTGQMTVDGNIFFPKGLKLPRGVKAARKQQMRDFLRSHNIEPGGSGNELLVYDETSIIEDARVITPMEAAWDFAGYSRTVTSHTVVTLTVHKEFEEPILFKAGQEKEVVERAQNDEYTSRLKQWFELNKKDEEVPRLQKAAQDLTFDEIPKYFKWENGRFIRRERDISEHIIGRIKWVHPRYRELFAIRLLAMNQRDIKSFEELRTVRGTVYDTFVDAAKAMRLMNGEEEWDMCIDECADLEIPIVIRRLFISILLWSAPTDPIGLWNRHKEQMFENKAWDEKMKIAHALDHIRSGLKHWNRLLSDFNLPEVIESDLPAKKHRVNDNDEEMSPEELQSFATKQYEERYDRSLTNEQRNHMLQISKSVEKKDGKVFFIDGCAGSGKTFMEKAFVYYLQMKGKKVACIAHTGIAATLLINGSTVHRLFELPLELEEMTQSRIDLESDKAQYLRELDCIIWDESTMSDRRIVRAVQELLANVNTDLRHQPFPGITMVFSGDWRQTLPIVENVSQHGIRDYTIKNHKIWNNVTILKLTGNKRTAKDISFGNWLQLIGEGTNYVDDRMQLIKVPEELVLKTEEQVIEWMFGKGQIEDTYITKGSVLLTVENKAALEINHKVLDKMSGKPKKYWSVDEHDPNLHFAELNPEVYNQMTPSGMPPHELRLKEGAIVILLRNINVSLGLCNGTRLRVIEMMKDVLICQAVTPMKRHPQRIVLHRMLFTGEGKTRDTAFHRTQFPVRLAFCLTINKAQGQTLDRVGLILRTPVFAHGQLYVALSRVRTLDNIRIFNGTTLPGQRNLIRNVVNKLMLC